MTHSDTAGVIAPPPIIFLSGILVGGLLNLGWPLPFVFDVVRWGLAGGLIVAGLALGLASIWAMRRAQTSVDPFEPSTAIVATGPYRYSRNPIYLGFVLISVGAACGLNSLWVILLLPVVIVTLHLGVIAREERYLERKFGETYLQYKASVRRWI
jgi:protein-S-isoprenylcysteine O-methyltransferase Ste14